MCIYMWPMCYTTRKVIGRPPRRRGQAVVFFFAPKSRDWRGWTGISSAAAGVNGCASNRLIRNYTPRGPLWAYGAVTLRYDPGRDEFLWCKLYKNVYTNINNKSVKKQPPSHVGYTQTPLSAYNMLCAYT